MTKGRLDAQYEKLYADLIMLNEKHCADFAKLNDEDFHAIIVGHLIEWMAEVSPMELAPAFRAAAAAAAAPTAPTVGGGCGGC